MAKYVCSICGFTYDEAVGIPEEGIAPGQHGRTCRKTGLVLFAEPKSDFEKQGETAASEEKKQISAIEPSTDMKELTPLEISALCTNLPEVVKNSISPKNQLFYELAEYFSKVSAPAKIRFDQLLALIEKDLEENIPNAKAVAAEAKDRGALRALTWGEKVTRMLKSILTRYRKEGDAMLENTGVYVCTICGFIYIGDKLPDVCPVCKVPNWKFEKVEGR